MTDLNDVTFLFPLRIDSFQRLENIRAVINYLLNNFKTKCVVMEADGQKMGASLEKISQVNYCFIEDRSSYLHHTYYRNLLMRSVNTPIVAIWDADIICNTNSVIDAIDCIRNNNAILSWPYEGVCFNLPPDISERFRKSLDVNQLESVSSQMPTMHGSLSNGGAFFANRKAYLQIGGENEFICGWGPEDSERLKRAAILGLPLNRSKGRIFHLYHPRNQCQGAKFESMRIHNMQEYLRICNMSQKDLYNEIEKWIANRF